MFSFALGAVSGFNIAKEAGQRPPFEDLPQSYSLVGGKLDSLAGDAILRVQKNNWFLIEMKRDFKELASELRKERVVGFLDALLMHTTSEEFESLKVKAEKAHQFLYLGRPTDRPQPELATLPYLAWARDVLDGKAPEEARRFAQPFWTFLADISKTPSGFTLQELALYVEGLSATESSGAGMLDMGALIAVATDSATGTLDLICNAMVMEILQEYLPKPAPAQVPSGDQPGSSYGR